MIRILFIILFLTVFPLASFAEVKEEAKLEEIVVIATKTEREVKDISTNVTVITRDDIEKYEARDLSDLLRQIPGFNISAFGSVHADMYVSSRGSVPLTRGAQILVDGIEYNNPSGYFNVLAIPIGDIERIEIVKSPVTSLYGNFGTGGIINVVTRKPTKPLETKFSASYGSFDTQKYFALINGTQKNSEYYFEGRFFKTHGWQENSWEEHKLLNTRFKYNFDETFSIGLYLNYAPLENGYPGTLTEVQFKQNPRQTVQHWGIGDSYTVLSALFFEKTFGNSKLFAKAKYGYQDGYCIDPDYFEFRNYNVIPEINYSLRHNILGLQGVLLIGGEYRYLNNEKIKAYEAPNGIKGNLYMNRTWKDSTFGLFIQEEVEMSKKFFASFGIRYDHVDTDFDDKLKPEKSFDKTHTAWSPKIGLTYTLSENINLFANYSKGFRNPTTAITGFSDNPDLEPEILNSYELGVRGQPKPWLYYNLAYFWVDTDDKIIRVGGPRKVENAGETRSTGFELGVGVDFENGFHASLNYTYQEAEFREYTTVAGISYKGNEIPLVPKHLLGVGIGYKSPLLGRMDLIINHSGKRYMDVANTRNLGDYTTLDAKYKRSIRKYVEIFLAGKNLTDERYVEVGFGGTGWEMLYPMPGRSITGGINLYF